MVSLVSALMTGNPVENNSVDLVSAGASVSINGEVKVQGTGADVLGDPFIALQWLANDLRFSHGLRPGDMISTGTMTGMLPVDVSDQVQIDFGSYGTIRAVVS